MTVIGLIADTHGFLDPSIADHFKDCDQIWHLGDIGDESILDKLKIDRAVYGNIDSKEIQWKLPENEIIELEGLRFLLTHIAGKPPRYNKRVRTLIEEIKPDVLICGHSHQETVKKDRENGIVFLNPGAAGKQGFHKYRHIMKIEVENKKITNLELIKLGKKSV
ncbi:metallophosphoesterase [Jiulongibacter sediminis]|jgi:putative phosphoesterase|uniref:metallophosphoesterase family protein n=1 Tax=Jiulongibacter sediminis TaxID=1605367 RepID=UPI0026EA607E|nr:metallophosphoesterase family protein [Jiulongibacter sediminis]